MVVFFLVQYLCEEVSDLALVLPVLYAVFDAVKHLHNLNICTAVTGTLKCRYSRSVSRISVCAGRGYTAAGKCRVVTAAMLCVEHKTKVEELCLLLCVLTVVTQG